MTKTPGAFGNLGRAIRMARTRKGWAQAELAERAGVTKPQISYYERGIKTPTIDSLERVMEALGMDLFDLAAEIAEVEAPGDAERRPRPSPLGRMELDRALGDLPEAELRQAVEAVLRFLAVFIRGERGRGGD